jgi:hypothetical protein
MPMITISFVIIVLEKCFTVNGYCQAVERALHVRRTSARGDVDPCTRIESCKMPPLNLVRAMIIASINLTVV